MGAEQKGFGVIRIPVQIERVLELEGAYDPKLSIPGGAKAEIYVYAHITRPIPMGADDYIQYALLARSPQHGLVHLGTIDRESRDYTLLEPMPTLRQAYYKRASNGVINHMLVPANQLESFLTEEEILKIPGLRVLRVLTPQ